MFICIKINMLHYILAFIAMLFYASLAPIAKKVSLENSIPPFLFIAVTMTILTLGAIILSWIYEKPKLSEISAQQWKLLFLFGVVNLIGFVVYLTSIKVIPVSHYTIIWVMTPIIAWFIAYLWFWEKLTINFFIWFILVAMWIFIAISKKSIF